MKIKKLDSYVEKSIITAMIVSVDFLQGFEYLYRNELFQIPYAKIIARWCWDYYETYTEAPNKTIQAIYKEKSEKLDEALCEAIEQFLDKLSTAYDQDSTFNWQYVLTQAEEYFQKRNILSLKDELQVSINNNDTKGAELAIANFNQLETPTGSGLDLFKDTEHISTFFNPDDNDNLFKFKGAAGDIIPSLCRGDLLAFAAPEKRGKSYALDEIAKQGLMRGFNVAEFNFEMKDSKRLARFIQSLTGSPAKEKDKDCLIPFFDCIHNQQGDCDKCLNKEIGKTKKGKFLVPDTYKPCFLCQNINKKSRMSFSRAVTYKFNSKPVLTPIQAAKKIKALKTYTKGNFKLISWPSNVKSIKDIKNQLLLWEKYEGFIVDIIITDYADLMIPENSKLEYRHGLDDIWKGHKKLAQEFNCAVCTATQTTKETYNKKINKGSPAEDKRKASHVDRMIALNQTQEEYDKGIMRWSMLFERDDKVINRDIVVLQQLAIGNAYLDSYVDDYKSDESESDKPKTRKRR